MTPQIAIVLPPGPEPQSSPVVSQARLVQALGRIPPTGLLLLSILSVQLGSALATTLFSSLGPIGTAFTSTAFSALVMTLVARPKIDGRILRQASLILIFGLVDSAMALPYFLALQRVPLGIVSAIAFLGPLGFAVATSRRPIHFLWIGFAALGVGLLTPDIGRNLDGLGLGLAAVAGLAWAGFVAISKQAGRVFDGSDGLTFGLWAASAMQLPFALVEGSLLHAGFHDLAGALAVALLSAVVPYAMEFQALQHISARTYGILVTLEPAVGALVGFVFLGQAIGPRMAIAIACVTVAAMGVTLFEKGDKG
jgi:inner membrane transporter RhtA